MILDYFYGQTGELFSFYRIPKALFQEPRFQSLSTDAKILYGILLDRMSLSVKNGWLDKQNRVFIILNVPLEEFEEFKSHSLSVRTPSGRKTDLKQAPVRGLGTPNGGIVVFDKTSGEAMNIMPKSSAHVTLRCQDEWCTILQRTAKRNAVSFNTIRRFMDSKGVEPSTFRMRTERSPSNIAFVHTLCTMRKEKSTYIRPYKMFCHLNYLSWSQVWSPSRWFSRWCSLGRNMVGGQVSYRPLRCNSHGVQMYRISIYNKIRYNVKAQLPLLMNGRCAFYIWQQVIDWQ